MRRRDVLLITSAVLLLATILACRGRRAARTETGCVVEGQRTPSAAWQAVCDEMDSIRQPRDVSIQIGDAQGTILTYTRGATTPQTYHAIASASKWMSSAAIMRLVARGELSLDDNPQKYISWWTDDVSDPRSEITLAHLLSFTSGFGGTPLEVKCARDGKETTDSCGRTFHDDYFEYSPPGSSFYYGPSHMHIAALMAEGATGKSWNTIFKEEVVTPLGLDSSTIFTAASEQNPRIAGGISTRGIDYAEFLRAQLAGEYLADVFDIMTRDHTPSSRVTIASSPLTAQDLEWHYAFGMWRECPQETFTRACDEHVRVSSPGLYGFYPWIDREHAYWAVMSTHRSLFANASADSVLAGMALQPLIERAMEEHRSE